jgi:hypothetical protein
MRRHLRWWPFYFLLLFPLFDVLDRFSWRGGAWFVAVVGAATAGFLAVGGRIRHRLEQWASAGGWTPVETLKRQWPWPSPHTVIRRAWHREIDGLPVMFGDIDWRNNALTGAAEQQAGSGTFVVVRLPHTQPSMGVSPSGEVVGDSPRAHQPALREAFRTGEIPAWAVRGDELFTIEPNAWTEPEDAERAVRRALLVVRMLDLGPDTTSNVAPGLDG